MQPLPGIGPFSARVLSNELGDMSQFPNEGALFSYLGLTPWEYSTGDGMDSSMKRRGHISRQGSARLRHILTEVAHRAVKKDEALAQFHKSVSSRRGVKRSITAVSRKIIGRVRACFKKNEQYKKGTGMKIE